MSREELKSKFLHKKKIETKWMSFDRAYLMPWFSSTKGRRKKALKELKAAIEEETVLVSDENIDYPIVPKEVFAISPLTQRRDKEEEVKVDGEEDGDEVPMEEVHGDHEDQDINNNEGERRNSEEKSVASTEVIIVAESSTSI